MKSKKVRSTRTNMKARELREMIIEIQNDAVAMRQVKQLLATA